MLDNIPSLSVYIPAIFNYPPSDSEDDSMGSPTPDSRRGSGMSRRDSIRSNSGGGRRPRLLRSSATEPSLTASTASRNALATPQSSRRATDLLNQVAYSGSPPNCASPLSQSPTSMSMSYETPSLGDLARSETVDLEGPFRPHLGT